MGLALYRLTRANNMKQQDLLQNAQGRVTTVLDAFASMQICREKLTGIATELAAYPDVRRMVDGFADRDRHQTRPMCELRKLDPSIYLLGWREGEFTAIHDHCGAEVAIVVVQGVITEDVFMATNRAEGRLEVCGSLCRIARVGELIMCPSSYIHRMGNTFPELAVTLHVYGPSLEGMRNFDVKSGDLVKHDDWRNEH
jgi:predicted metal-dependent enzyme (double-stranded beta helix superfamily)